MEESEEKKKKEGLLKKLKNNEDKTNRNKKEDHLSIKIAVNITSEKLSLEEKNVIVKLVNQAKLIKYKWLYFKASIKN